MQKRPHPLIQTPVVALLLLLQFASVARAGGFDVPIVYTARYGGMGGTAISFVDGGASLYLNPAGLGRIGKGNVDVAVTIVDGQIHGSPSWLAPDVNINSERTQIPFPFVTGGARLTDFLTIGAGAYLAGGAGGEFKYSPSEGEPEIDDKTQLVFIETSLGLAANFDDIGLTIGAAYRVTIGRLDRTRPDGTTNLDLKMQGVDFKGIRVGFQWQANKYFSIGAMYRNKLEVDMSGTGGGALNVKFDTVESTFVFPAQVGTGFRIDYNAFAFATDFLWLFNSQNKIATFTSTPALPFEVSNTFDWSDQIFLRFGFEYRVAEESVPLRLGFMYESTTSSREFPNAFQPPPAPGYIFTMGIGYDHGPWQVNAAYARGFSSTTVNVDTSNFLTECPNCGGSGLYELVVANHFLFDFSYDWK